MTVEHQCLNDPGSTAWYAVYTKHQHEKSAKSILAQKGFEVLLPLYRSAHRWKDRTQIVLLPIFPCYLFLRASLNRKLEILRTPGVFWLVENAGHACAVPDSDIEGIRKITEGAAHAEPHPFLKTGMRVRVKVGPLAGVEGILSRVKNQYRIVLSVELLRQAVSVEVDISIVEPLGASRGVSLQALMESGCTT